MHNTPNMVCVWRHAEHTIYGVLCTLYFLQCSDSGCMHQHSRKRGLGCLVAACDAQKCRNRLDGHQQSRGGRYLHPCYLPRCVLLVEHFSCPGRGHGTQYFTGCAGGSGRSLKGGLHVSPRESNRCK